MALASLVLAAGGPRSPRSPRLPGADASRPSRRFLNLHCVLSGACGNALFITVRRLFPRNLAFLNFTQTGTSWSPEGRRALRMGRAGVAWVAAAGGRAPLSGAGGVGPRREAGRSEFGEEARGGGTGVCEMPHHKGLLWAEGPRGGGSPQGRERAGPPARLTPAFPAGAPSSLPHVHGLLLGVQDVEGSLPPRPTLMETESCLTEGTWRCCARPRWPSPWCPRSTGGALAVCISPVLWLWQDHRGGQGGAGMARSDGIWVTRRRLQSTPGCVHPRRLGLRGPGLVGDCGGPAGQTSRALSEHRVPPSTSSHWGAHHPGQ